ncbi:MAG: leucine--tRNA ligase [Bacteroidota bacterium]
MGTYNFQEIEKKWQKKWKEDRVFVAEKLSDKPKYYVMDMFPYPSGKGLHVGHPLGFIATDIMARYKRVKGYNVLYPMGFDSFGLPAEQYAIKTGIHPAITTEKNIKHYWAQLENVGFSYDPDSMFSTADPEYYKWTQWIFIKMYQHWYNKTEECAQPIEELVKVFEKKGNAGVLAATTQEEAFTPEEWKAMRPPEQEEILMRYRIAYLDYATVNWCPALGTVLANEEVKDGKSERGGHPVERKKMRQWMLRITAYSDRLLKGLEILDWPDSLEAMQKNWIGRSEGASIHYEIVGHEERLEVFTTRPDTIFGNMFMVIAPEHPLVEKLTTKEQKAEVETYVDWAKNRSEVERMADTTKTGVFTGAYTLNPFTEEKLPIWISDYVVITYGTGAIMCVPGHDDRDYEFANKFDIPIREVIAGGDLSKEAYTSKEGKMVNSGFLNGLSPMEAIKAMNDELENRGIGKRKITYRQRDVVWSRQRYWGEPTPIIHKDGVTEPVAWEDLPLDLPEVDQYKPSATGEPPLSRAQDWVNLPDGGKRDMNTMPNWAGSSWYFLRYPDAHNDKAFADPKRMDYWLPVDLYIGGTEHAVGHLMYSRFWTKFLKDLGYLSVEEPFQKLVNQGMIQGTSQMMYRHKKTNKFVSADLIPEGEINEYSQLHADVNLVRAQVLDVEGFKKWTKDESAQFVLNEDKEFRTVPRVEKMSKSYYNTVDPDDMCAQYGADTFRIYEMFLGPIELSKPWNTDGINGVISFMRRMYNLFINDAEQFQVTDEPATKEELKALHTMIKQVGEGIDRMAFNTCVPAFMVFVKELGRMKCYKREVLEPFLICLSPFAPHVCEELWEMLGHGDSITLSSFPDWEEQYLVEDTVEYPVQINGKVRFKLSVPADMGREDIGKEVLAHETAQKWLEGKEPKKLIVVPGRIVNVVI